MNKITYIDFGSKKFISSAAVNRMSALQKGIKAHGQYCEIKFIYFGYPHFIFARYLNFIYSILTILVLAVKSRRKENFIFCGENNISFLFPIIKIFVKRLIVERTEYPIYLISENEISKKRVKRAKQFEENLKYADGFITCSNSLKKHYSQFLKAEVLILPLVVDVQKFDIDDRKVNNYIAYCGDFGNNKDGVPILIRSFAMIADEFPEIKLVLIGGSTDDVIASLIKLVDDLNLQNRVVFKGKIPHSEMPILLGSALLLALARPANKQAEGGIPSKIGEYLASSRPVVATDVGELCQILKNGENAYIAKPDSVIAFADRMREALLDDNRESIAKNGYELAQFLDCSIQSKILLDYCDSI